MKTKITLPYFDIDLSSLWENVPLNLEHILTHADTSLKEKFASKKVGFFDWPNEISENDLSEIEALATEIKKNFRSLLCVGIGGSYLGPAAVMQALRSPEAEETFPVQWLTNIDSASIQKTAHFLKQNKNNTSTLIISKSGNTTETLSGFFHFSDQLNEKGFIAITDPATGELRKIATKRGWKTLPVPPSIGGRFSVLTAVGLLPCEIAGLSSRKLIAGAKKMREHLLLQPLTQNAAALFAFLTWHWNTNANYPLHYMMPYDSRFVFLSHWFVQLWGESLGKKNSKGDAVGFTPVTALGTLDQHSLLQLFKEGPSDKVIGFVTASTSQKITVKKPELEVSESFQKLFNHSFEEINELASFATEKSLKNSMVPTYRIHFSEVNAEALGAFFFFQEYACALAGELYQVDAFNQPGVEEAKVLWTNSL